MTSPRGLGPWSPWERRLLIAVAVLAVAFGLFWPYVVVHG